MTAAEQRHLAGEIVVRRGRGDEFSLQIDGVEFPYWITPAGVSTSVADNDVPYVTVQIMAERVTVDNDLRKKENDG